MALTTVLNVHLNPMVESWNVDFSTLDYGIELNIEQDIVT